MERQVIEQQKGIENKNLKDKYLYGIFNTN